MNVLNNLSFVVKYKKHIMKMQGDCNGQFLLGEHIP